MKLEKEVTILPIITYDEGKDIFKGATFFVNVPELTKDEMKIIDKLQLSKVKLTLGESILDNAERKYLSDVIRPFRNRVKYISKCHDSSNIYKEYIFIYLQGPEYFSLPYFKLSTMYKGMKSNEKYTVEELGL